MNDRFCWSTFSLSRGIFWSVQPIAAAAWEVSVCICEDMFNSTGRVRSALVEGRTMGCQGIIVQLSSLSLCVVRFNGVERILFVKIMFIH